MNKITISNIFILLSFLISSVGAATAENIVVKSSASGNEVNTLGWAINRVNSLPTTSSAPHSITFEGVSSISNVSASYKIKQPVKINGILVNGNKVSISGTSSDGIFYFLPGSDGSEIKGLEITSVNKGAVDGIVIEAPGIRIINNVINNCDNGVLLYAWDARNVVIQGNYIGTDKTGTIAKGNKSGIGFRRDGSGLNYLIGGASVNERNVISGNDIGIDLNAGEGAGDVTIIGNFIGTNATGNGKISNDIGIVLDNFSGVDVGGTRISDRNVISNNTTYGIVMSECDGSSNGIHVMNNYIGVDVTGEFPAPNGSGIEIRFSESISIGHSDGVSGRNIIAGNKNDGIVIENSKKITIQTGNNIGVTPSSKTLTSEGYGIVIRLGMETSTWSEDIYVGTFSRLQYNPISGHKSGGIYAEYVKGLFIYRNKVANNNASSEVMIVNCEDIKVGNMISTESRANKIHGNLIVNKSKKGEVVGNEIKAGIILKGGTTAIAMAENKIENTIMVSEGSYDNMISRNSILSNFKPIYLDYEGKFGQTGNENVKPPVITEILVEEGIVKGTCEAIDRGGQIQRPTVVEIFSTDSDGKNAYEFLGCTVVGPGATTWTANNVNLNIGHKFIFANITEMKSFAPDQGSTTPEIHTGCELVLLPVSTSEFSIRKPLNNCGSFGIGGYTLTCAGNSLTFNLSKTSIKTSLSDLRVKFNYGDGSPVEILGFQNSYSHKYEKPGKYDVTVDIERKASDNTYSRHPCLPEPLTYPITIKDCTPCEGCVPSFAPIPGKQYVFSAWVKESVTNVVTYDHTEVILKFGPVEVLTTAFKPKGEIIDGWQRIEEIFTIPDNAETIEIKIRNTSSGTASLHSFIDDIRIHPFNSTMKTYAYDPDTYRLMAEMDANNYATFFEYDEEGGLIRIKKETERGIMTIQENRSNTIKR